MISSKTHSVNVIMHRLMMQFGSVQVDELVQRLVIFMIESIQAMRVLFMGMKVM